LILTYLGICASRVLIGWLTAISAISRMDRRIHQVHVQALESVEAVEMQAAHPPSPRPRAHPLTRKKTLSNAIEKEVTTKKKK